MKRVLRTAVVVKLSALLLALATPGIAVAATDAYIDCSTQSNACFADAFSDSGPVTFMYQFDYSGIDAVFPSDCTNQYVCSFYCPRYPGPLQARLLVYDANWQLLATTEWVSGMCTQQDMVLE
ncbi:MAG: hypothetical protein H0W24_12165 [Lysobacter sp.]|nr:hypothetical protein [Lysobacter sp.]MDQ3269320.1 hypothetical protein [Pseudomonadota bacterium]